MKIRSVLHFIISASLLSQSPAPELLAAPLSSGFNFSGQVNDGGSPANGTYDLQFSLHDAPVAGSQVGSMVPFDDQAINGGSLSATLDFGSAAFDGSARWLQIGLRPGAQTGPFTVVSPRALLNAVPYAVHALHAGSSSAGFSANGSALYYSGGSVGIGTSSPEGSLDVVGNWSLFQPALVLRGDRPTIQFKGDLLSANHSWGIHLGADPAGSLQFFNDVVNGFVLSLRNDGNVGIGSADPKAKLEIVGQDAIRLIGHEPFLTFFDSNHGFNHARIQSVDGNLTLLSQSYLRGNNPSGYLLLAPGGNVGIGSPDPKGKLEVMGQDAIRLVGDEPFLTLFDAKHGFNRARVQNVDGGLRFQTESFIRGDGPNRFLFLAPNGNVGLGTFDPQTKLDVIGRTRTSVLEITGGADVAEPFPMEDTIEEGSVVIIDDEQPGRLKQSTRAYDTRVAGVISGANGINPGIVLKQEGTLEQGKNVSLTGRVYVRADASYGAIKPGDLLTTSDTLGHAMKATDHSRAQGAILGKAMSVLREGKGFVLVLVSLQ